jgi:hypothetical protein
MEPCPRDANLKNGSHRWGERETPAKQQQDNAWATKAQQDWPINMAINSRLLICKTEIGEALYYAKPALKVDPYFQVLAVIKLLPFLLSWSSYIQPIN